MSQCLILFYASGSILYQVNNRTSPFNDYISHVVDESATSLDRGFLTAKIAQKRFYSLQKDELYSAVYFDAVYTIPSEKVRTVLTDIIKTYRRLSKQEEDYHDKLNALVQFQFNDLMQLDRVPQSTQTEDRFVKSATTRETSSPARGKSSKIMRKWDGSSPTIHDGAILDYSESDALGDKSLQVRLTVDSSNFVRDKEFVLVDELREILNESADEDEDYAPVRSGFFSKIGALLGGNVDLEEVTKRFHHQLVSKNIAASTATQITNKIKQSLSKNPKVTMKVYKQALYDELTKILTPNVLTDLLYSIKRNKETSNRPYVISIVGVNGVGKSTNLAKLAFWFLQNDLKVLICACDTFRSGAVEQLKVHVNNLKSLSQDSGSNRIDLFEKGYGSGDHVVATAKLAIEFASREEYDVVLIDTAGRTHSNTKLMAPLKKFGDAANPDKIIMVGEALVGTDSVEQAINFNSAFGNKRGLDFFIISKVDTVGDLVGAMINMVMATKVPILLMGTGQTYTDIKRLSVKTVVDMLLS